VVLYFYILGLNIYGGNVRMGLLDFILIITIVMGGYTSTIKVIDFTTMTNCHIAKSAMYKSLDKHAEKFSLVCLKR